MKRGLSFILSLIMVMGFFTSLPLTVNAADASVLTFKLDGTGTDGYAVTDCDTSVSGELVIPDTYNGKPVTVIGSDAFRNCTGLTRVTIPDTVISIHSNAFYNCTGLQIIKFSDNLESIGDYAFYGCAAIQQLYLPDSLEAIGSYAFAGLHCLLAVTIPEKVTRIENYTFYDCKRLSGVVIEGDLTEIGGYAFANNESLITITIPETVEFIGMSAFENVKNMQRIQITDLDKWCQIDFYNQESNPLLYCYNLYQTGPSSSRYCYLYLNDKPVTDLVISDNVEKISAYAFINYTHMKSITLPDTLNFIGIDAFYGTDGMEAVYISNMDGWMNIDFQSVTANPLSWGDNSKLYLNGELVTSLNVPESVTEIKNYAFYDCTTLENIEVHGNINKIGASAFYNTAFYKNTENWENGLLYAGDYLVAANNSISGDLEIPQGTKAIAEEAFSGRSNIKTVKIPDSVTEIAYRTFFNCYNLTSVDLGKGVKSIGEGAFYDCHSLTTLTLNENIEKIDDLAFYACGELALDISLNNVAYIGENAFYNCVGIKSVHIKGSNAEIGAKAFEGCTGITAVVLDGVKTIGERVFYGCTGIDSVQLINIETLGEYAFSGCSSLKHLDLGTQLKEISMGAFFTNTLLEKVDFPESLEYIGRDAFYNCIALSELVIGKNVSFIGDYAFYDCEGIKSIEVYSTELDTNVMAFLGCYNVKKLYIDTQSAIYEVPVSIFTALEDVTLGETITEIPEYRFSGSNFRTISIPKSVTKIYYDAFNECPNLATVYYGGSPSKWNAISIGINNDALLNAEIIFAEHDHEATEEWIVDVEATCSTVGSQHKVCLICGIVVETEEIPMKEHIPSEEWIVDIEASCTKEGSQHKDCIACGVVAQTQEIPMKKHTSGAWITDKKATVNAKGKKHKECTECGKVLETAEIPQLKAGKPKLKSIENTEYGVLIKWGKVSGADKYRVYRKTSKSDWECIATTSNTYYTDKKAKSGTKYYYAVKSQNEAGNSSLSSSLSKYYLADTTLKTPSSTKSGVKLTWSKVTGAEGYMVYRKTGTGSYSKIATVKGSTKVTYTDKSARKSKKYTYKVKAYKSKTYSAYSNTKTITDKY